MQLLQEKINELELKNEQLREELKNANFELNNTRVERDNYKTDLGTSNKNLDKLKLDWQ